MSLEEPRTKRQKKASQFSLEGMKEAREGKSRLDQFEFEEDKDVFEVVDEDKYAEIVEKRRNEGDFVVDDDGLGYHDDGEEVLGIAEDAYDAKKRLKEASKEGDQKAARKARMLAEASTAPKGSIMRHLQSGISNTGKALVAPMKENSANHMDIDQLVEATSKPTMGFKAGLAGGKVANLMGRRNVMLNATMNMSRAMPIMHSHYDSPMDAMMHDDGGAHYDGSPEGDDSARYTGNYTTPTMDGGGGRFHTQGDAAADRINEIAQASDPIEKEKVHKISLTKSNKTFKADAYSFTSTPKMDGSFRPQLNAQSMMDMGGVFSSPADASSPASSQELTPGGGSGMPSASKVDASQWLLYCNSATQEGPYVNMYWLDATELNGVLYLFGKIPLHEAAAAGAATAATVAANKEKQFVSCCVAVHGCERNLFVLPKVLPDRYKEDNTPLRTNMADVHKEIGHLMKTEVLPHAAGAGFKAKPVKRKYAFEHGSVPRDTTDYLKVVYSGKYGAPSAAKCEGGQTYERIFGANSSLLELFLLKRKLMGPCWITIKEPKINPDNVSWCRVDIAVEQPKAIAPMVAEKDKSLPNPPALTTMCISMKTAVNPVTHTHEIVALSSVFHNKVDPEGDTEINPKHMKRIALIRQLGVSCGSQFPTAFPHDLDPKLKAFAKDKNGFLVNHFVNERAMLSFFFSRIQLEDPDILVSHNLLGFECDVLLARAVHNKLPNWSLLGRLRKSKPPKSINDRDAAAGRILCDTYKAAKEFLRETTYSLTHLAQSQLQFNRTDVDPIDVPKYFSSADEILLLAQHTACDSFLVQRLMLKLQVIPLTKQLTNLSGNLWSRTIRGARAERIEYLLLHEFHAAKYVLPEKKAFDQKKGNKNTTMEDEDDEMEAITNQVGGMSRKRAKAAYAGGLVLEPKKGLYDTYILLLDFNSLYPSIIQEYNLCFTTIDWTKFMPENSATTPATAAGASTKGTPKKGGASLANNNNEESDDGEDSGDDDAAAASGGNAANKYIPPLPDSGLQQGILPRVIRTLVDRRKQVKGLLKKERDPAVRQSLDIRQKALKLTANSMYGCLGFTFSRFYARPIAALVTSQGREALQRTVDTASNKMNLDVIYGDTDSVMINTNSTDLAVVKELGNKVKKDVNTMYKSLELDLDGIFKSMLLLKKKKYAAVVINEGPDGKVTYEKEMKGLDLVRRDWCPISKEAGRYIVEQILSGKTREEIVLAIHDYLADLSQKIRSGQVDLSMFIVTKGLNKNPKDYPDCKGQAHLQVALQMLKENKPVNIGDHIPYVICKEGPEGSQPAQRAHHPDDVLRCTNNELTLDYEWYLSNQILPPVSRLCEPIEGTSPAILSERLGLDASKYARQSNRDDVGEDGWGFTPKCQMDDAERFKDCVKLQCICSACKETTDFSSVLNMTEGKGGLSCMNCGALYFGRNTASDCYCYISNRVTLLVRECTKRYYNCWLRCDEHGCARRTLQQTMRGRRCTDCTTGSMSQEYTEEELYTQLKYLESLFDVTRLQTKKGLTDATLKQLIPKEQIGILNLLRQHMANSVNGSAYNWIRPSLWSSLFGKINLGK